MPAPFSSKEKGYQTYMVAVFPAFRKVATDSVTSSRDGDTSSMRGLAYTARKPSTRGYPLGESALYCSSMYLQCIGPSIHPYLMRGTHRIVLTFEASSERKFPRVRLASRRFQMTSDIRDTWHTSPCLSSFYLRNFLLIVRIYCNCKIKCRRNHLLPCIKVNIWM